jgi:hypothetical protein
MQPRSQNCEKMEGTKPPINYLLRDFRTWLVTEKINDKREEIRISIYRKSSRSSYRKGGVNTIPRIEKLRQTPIADYRKYAIWRILNAVSLQR